MLAGILIAVSAIVYLKIGGVVGAFLFSIGLLTILHFKLGLFTGKAGLLSKGRITPIELISIYG